MIAYLKGIVYAYGIDYVIVEVNNIGYRVHFNKPESLVLNASVTLFTYQHVREDEISLFGFLTLQEHDLFLKLIQVKGLGPKTALNILKVTSVEDFIVAIETNDLASIKKLPGIGNKTASQIILDLKGKLVQDHKEETMKNLALQDAIEALKALGYKQSEINQVMKSVAKEEGLSSEQYVKLALQKFMLMKRG